MDQFKITLVKQSRKPDPKTGKKKRTKRVISDNKPIEIKTNIKKGERDMRIDMNGNLPKKNSYDFKVKIHKGEEVSESSTIDFHDPIKKTFEFNTRIMKNNPVEEETVDKEEPVIEPVDEVTSKPGEDISEPEEVEEEEYYEEEEIEEEDNPSSTDIGVCEGDGEELSECDGEDNGESGSVEEVEEEEIAAQLIPEGSKESLDSLKEIAQWVQDHPDDADEIEEYEESEEDNSIPDEENVETETITINGEVMNAVELTPEEEYEESYEEDEYEDDEYDDEEYEELIPAKFRNNNSKRGKKRQVEEDY